MDSPQYATDGIIPGVGLVDRMRARVGGLHGDAEQSGIIIAILSGYASRQGYALYLRNLLPAYQAMEAALTGYRHHPGLGPLAQRSLFRADSILADLNDLSGADALNTLPLLPSAERYAARITRAADAPGGLLIAHAYTRYMGDLNGGQIIRRRLRSLFGPDFSATAFTDFPAVTERRSTIAKYRAVLERAGEQVADQDAVVEEAAVAFVANIDLSREVAAVETSLASRDKSASPGQPNRTRTG